MKKTITLAVAFFTFVSSHAAFIYVDSSGTSVNSYSTPSLYEATFPSQLMLITLGRHENGMGDGLNSKQKLLAKILHKKPEKKLRQNSAQKKRSAKASSAKSFPIFDFLKEGVASVFVWLSTKLDMGSSMPTWLLLTIVVVLLGLGILAFVLIMKALLLAILGA